MSKIQDKKTIGVFFGGKSTEHDVSVVTAIASVIKPLELTRAYDVQPIYIAKDGRWYWDERLKDIATFSSGAIDALLEEITPVDVRFDDGLVIVKRGTMGRVATCKIDVAFPATHGTFGEDGSLMGVLRMANVPYVGCDMEASVIAMNKLLSHQVVAAHGIEQHAYQSYQKHEFEGDSQRVIAELDTMKYPLFVKPVHLGSSIGISRVTKKSELENALEVAFHYDDVVIVEEAVQNLVEVTVPVMGTTDAPEVGLVERPLLGDAETFDFDTKYLKGGGKKGQKGGKSANAQGYSELPAKISKALYARSEELARQIFTLTGCYGIARVDMLIDSKAKKVYFNEINPLPGSLYMHNWRAAGVPTVQLVARLVELAESRAAQQKNVATSFSTNYLQQF